jgi:hypothetical protein
MSQQSNFRNRAVVEKVGVFYRPIRHGDLRDTQTQPRPGLAAGAFSFLSGIFKPALVGAELLVVLRQVRPVPTPVPPDPTQLPAQSAFL